MNEITTITQDTDFTLRVRAKRVGYNSYVKVSFTEISNITAKMVSLPNTKTAVSHIIDDQGRLIIHIDGTTLDCNTYALELTGFYNNGNWRQQISPAVEIVNSTNTENLPYEETDDITIDLEVTLGETYVSSRAFTKALNEMGLENLQDRTAALEQGLSALPASIPTKNSQLTNDSNFQTAQQVSNTVQSAINASLINDAEASLVEDGGDPALIAGISGQKIILVGKNLKGNKGDTGPQGETGPQGVPGDVGIYNPDDPNTPDFQMAQTTGLSTTKSMTQEAITRELRPVKRILNDFTWEAKMMHPATPHSLKGIAGFQTAYAYPIKAGDRVVVDTANNSNNQFTVIAYLTTADQASGWAIKASNTYTDGARHTFQWTATDDGYVRVCGYASDMDAYIMVGNSLATQQGLDTEKARINSINEQIKGVFDAWTWNAGMLHPNNASVVSNSDFKYSNPVTVHKGDVVTVKTWYPNSGSDQAKNFTVIARYSGGTRTKIDETYGAYNQYITRTYKCNVEEEQICVCVYVGDQDTGDGYSAEIERADALVKRGDIKSLLDSGLPDYWQTYLAAKMPGITVPAGGDSFLFVTDTHYSENYGRSTDIIATITKSYPFSKVIHGGDSCSTGFTTSNDGVPKTYEQLCIREMKAYDRLARKAGDYARFYGARGNHDFNEYNGGNKYYHSVISSCKHIRKVIDDMGVVDGGATNRLYYYVDNIEVDVKIRYIFIDSNDRPSSDSIGIDQTQLQWVASTLASTPSSYKIVFVGHAPASKYFAGSNETYLDWFEHLRNIMLAFNARESGTEGGVEYDFTTSGASIILFLHGHTHIDNQCFHEGIPFVGTMCDKYNHHAWSPFGSGTALANSPKSKGTTGEQAIEAVVISADKSIVSLYRVGLGYDRHFDVGKVELAVGETHTFTPSKITAASWMISDEDVASNNAKNPLNQAAADYVIPTKNDYATISDGVVTAVAAGDVLVVAEDENHNKEFFHVKVTAE